MSITPPTYPMRPSTGGHLNDLASPPIGVWDWQPKANDWRMLVHLPSGSFFNRQGEPLSIADTFDDALGILRQRFHREPIHGGGGLGGLWLDCLGIGRRTPIGKGSIFVIDLPEMDATFRERDNRIKFLLPTLNIEDKPRERIVYSMPTYWSMDMTALHNLWIKLQKINTEFGCEFWEGLVAKRADSRYNLQLTSPEQKSSAWIKYRFIH